MQPTVVNRRDLLQSIAVGAGCSVLGNTVGGFTANVAPPRIVDTNVSLFQWPFRRLPLDSTEPLVKKLRSLGVVRAWAGSYEALLHRNVADVNQRLAETCSHWPELVPIGTVNPTLPGWREDLNRCIEQHVMPGIRLHPSYHRYSLADIRFTEFLERATEAGCFVQIAVAMEDARTQHSLVRVTEVDVKALPKVLQGIPGSVVQLLNARLRPAEVKLLSATEGIYFDTARVEGTDGVPRLVNSLPQGRVLFGSHAPLLIPEAAMIRIHESGQLGRETLQQVFATNAEQIFGQTRA